MPPKEHYDFKIVICKDENGNTFDLATAMPVLDYFDPKMDDNTFESMFSSFNETLTFSMHSLSLKAFVRKMMKRWLGIHKAEVLFPKKHRHKASIARRRRRYHGRTKNVCQNDNRQ